MHTVNRATRRRFVRALKSVHRGTKVPGKIIAALNLDALNTAIAGLGKKVTAKGFVRIIPTEVDA